MPFSFIEIEQKKTRVIGLLFIFIILFYFLTAYVVLLILENTYFLESQRSGLHFPPLEHILIVFAIALFLGLLHWATSTSNLIEKISLAVGASPANQKDTYHQVLKNIVDEVSVAIGGRPLEARVIPSVSMNAFAIEDFKGRAVIGVTEGLLSRLNRAQIEAVVGHEAGHIISGDCLSTTVTCALAEIYEETVTRLSAGLRGTRGRGSAVLVLVVFAIFIMRFLSTVIRYFISRQREYRADAIGVRLTRDPLSLAEALKLISRGWRGEGVEGDKLQSIFIVNPSPSELDESEGLFSDVFSTHPPIKNRIDILINMAHMDEKTLEENLKNFKRVSPVAKAEFTSEEPSESQKWSIFIDQKWLGPFSLGELSQLDGFKPDQWIKLEGQESVKHAYEDKALMRLFRQGSEDGKWDCPHCKTPLDETIYEGAPVHKCSYCEGVFVEPDKISRILIRQDKEFSEEAIRVAQAILKQREKFVNGLTKANLENAWILDCPKEKNKMRRQFFVYSYPVEIDRCVSCGGIWFDCQELEILQYIYEHKEQYFDGNGF